MKASREVRLANVPCRISPTKTLTALGTVLGLVFLSLGTVSFAQPNVTPAQYLASQPKPNFAPGNHLPQLTRWGWCLSSNACVELANNWDYALPLSNYATPGVASNTAVPGTFDYGMAQLAKNNPAKYKLSVLIDRTLPNPVPNGFWSTNSAGLFVDYYSNSWPKNVYTNGAWRCSTTNSADWKAWHPWMSPEAPDDYMATRSEYQMKSLRMIQSNCPIAIVLNGGEYDLQVDGWGQPAWQQDVRVQAQSVMTNNFGVSNPTNTNGMSWCRYVSLRKAHQLGFLTTAIEQQLPNRELYIFYHTDDELGRGYTPTDLHWMNFFAQWSWWSDYMNTNTDLPSFEFYYGNTNQWVNATNGFLTQYLNQVGYDINLGYKTNYSWVSGGWSTNDPTALSDIPRYTGFLKCLYTAGMNGGIACYFSYPSGTNNGFIFGGPGFDAAFPSNSPPHWLQQMMALSQVHALFSRLETFTDNSDLISGPQCHVLSNDQPAYEFTNTVADATARVLARKLRTDNQWLVTAWAASGTNRNVTVNIPVLGAVTVLARDSGAVYQATTTNTTLIDLDGMHPTAQLFTCYPTAQTSPPTNVWVVPGSAN
jgi:hypothetical protein